MQGEGRRLWLSGERINSGADPSMPLQFDFDGILPASVPQQSVFEAVARPLVDAATAGNSACLMCYGQTGTGKTYTFGGGACLKSMAKSVVPVAEKQRKAVSEQKARGGVVGRALRQVLEWAGPRGMRVAIAYVQVYMELLQDLLRPESNVSLREHPDLGVYLDGACWKPVPTAEAACAQVAEADARRTTAFTRLNADSSRSHAVLLVSIRNPADADAPPPITTRGGNPLSADAEWASSLGRLFLVDLAGSERTKRSGAIGQNFDEACSINQSLTTLGRCIQVLASAKSATRRGSDVRTPVRESKLTRLLSPCLGGAMTSLVCCVSAAAADRYETLSTLEFGRNAMRVMLKPQSALNVDFRALTIQLQTQLDERVIERHELEAEVHAKVRAEYEERIAQLEGARRAAEAATFAAELALDRQAGAEREATSKAAEVTAELASLQAVQESAAKTSRASHDSRAAIIATADSLAEEVVRARRDRDETLHQLELLSSQLGAAMPVITAACGHANSAGTMPAEARLPEAASAVERECAGAIAELSAYRTQLERRKTRTRAAAARGGLGAGGGGSAEQRATGDRKALRALRSTISGALGGFSELLATCVELTETSHPDLWQGLPEQLVLTEQIRSAQRLVHMLGSIRGDFC